MTLLALTACAVLAGARSLLAVSEWVADAPPALLERLGTAVDPLVPKRSWPAESTIRRLLARIDADALDRAVGAWLADRQTRGQGLRGLVVDGKSLRGAARAKGRKIHLLAAYNHVNAAPCPSRPHMIKTDDRKPRRSPASKVTGRPARLPFFLRLAAWSSRVSDQPSQSPSRESAESGNILAQRRDEEVKVAACRVRTDRVDVVA
ncbi:transposase family protein [Streptomyces sp. NPDC059590]|uniref:transposase family protein n=1 Tax=Streptomyces sp. NPDC059590 TaxID=3346877 RepID=UPI00369DAF1E